MAGSQTPGCGGRGFSMSARWVRNCGNACHDQGVTGDEAALQRVLTAAGDARGMLHRLQPMLAEMERDGPATGVIGRSAPESSEPWARRAGAAYWDLHYGARTAAGILRTSIGLTVPHGVYGAAALDVVVNAAPSALAPALARAGSRLETWVERAEAIPGIDEGETWSPVPALPGHPPPECPYCRTFGLRMRKAAGVVRCMYPGCRDGDGNPTRARMEAGRMTGEERLVFGDGTTMHWSGQDA